MAASARQAQSSPPSNTQASLTPGGGSGSLGSGAASKSTGGASNGGNALGPEIVQLGNGAVASARIAYEFAFVYDREALAARGIEPPPLAVTPVLAEVVLTYRLGHRMERIEDLDE